MTKKFSSLSFIKKLCDLGERQLENEIKAFNLIVSELRMRKINFVVQPYSTSIPKYKDYFLTTDGKKIECMPCGFLSGEINNNFSLISNLTSSQNFIFNSNINFNPVSKGISRSNHYFAPALSINKKDVANLLNAKKIYGKIEVKKTNNISKNIMVGNITNPTTIIFSHYDSIGIGAVDNASGVALSLDLIINSKVNLQEILFVICGNEELSYDKTVYWGHGYREFEKKYLKQLEYSKKIIILDSFGYSIPKIYKDKSLVMLGFPIKNISKYSKKIRMISGDFEQLMKFYHTNDDTPELIKNNFMTKTKDMVIKLIQ